MKPLRSARRFLIPEVIQMSAMDCGPAALKSLLDGFGLSVDYDSLRAACRTDVDGTSINDLGRVAKALGLNVSQLMVPPDHVFVEEAAVLPALVVLRHPNGNTHFAVIWSVLGGLVQMMDPASGRLWRKRAGVSRQLHRHTALVSAESWRKWAGTKGFTDPLRRRIRDLGVEETAAAELLSIAIGDSSWKTIATLDAAVRSLHALADATGQRTLKNSAALLRRLLADCDAQQDIPDEFWLVRSAQRDLEKLEYRGAVVLRARTVQPLQTPGAVRAISPQLTGITREVRPRPLHALLKLLQEDGVLNAWTLVSLWLLNAGTLILQALLLRAVFVVAAKLVTRSQIAGGTAALATLLLVLLISRFASAKGLYRYARRIDMQFRRLVMRKVPRLSDQYFQTRLPADVAERTHSIALMRSFPFIASKVVSCCFEIILTAAGIVWLDPVLWPCTAALAVVSLLIPLCAQPMFAAHELRARVHNASLGRFYFDTLLGVPAIRAHSAEKSVFREHQSLVAEWVLASLRVTRLAVSAMAVQFVTTMSLAGWLVYHHVRGQGDATGTLLLVYWAFNLPFLATVLTDAVQLYQSRRNSAWRLLDLIHGPEETTAALAPHSESASRGVEIAIENVSVRLSGHTILESATLVIAPGEHVAVVGTSGAGKSTLVGLLLGWSPISEGSVLIDRTPVTRDSLVGVYRATVWVDPAVQIWNRSLLENVVYGADGASARGLANVIAEADLLALLQSLPDGFQTQLGEGGGLVSGGEGQRVRLARAMCHPRPRLAILDEPFRGLDRNRRMVMLRRARKLWREATLLCVTHDIATTREFDRIVVVDRGRIVEVGSPSELANAGSHYAALVEADLAAREWWTRAGVWRHITVEKGTVVERV